MHVTPFLDVEVILLIHPTTSDSKYLFDRYLTSVQKTIEVITKFVSTRIVVNFCLAILLLRRMY